jgi:hypothetical protein
MQRRARGISSLRPHGNPTPSRRSGRCRPPGGYVAQSFGRNARLHASWWDSRCSASRVERALDPEAMDRQMQHVATDFQRFCRSRG